MGSSLEAVRDRKARRKIESVAELKAFFAECDRREKDRPERDWEEHLRTMSASRASRQPGT
jgi:hypothetical protein